MKQATTALMLKHTDPEFEKEAKYFTELSDKMLTVERIVNRLHDDRSDLSKISEEYSSALFQWATLENTLSQPLQKLANCVDRCDTALRSLVSVYEYNNNVFCMVSIVCCVDLAS